MEEKIFVGVDSHKATIACFVNDKFKEFKTTLSGFKQALKWAPKDCSWVIEGAYHYGLTFATFLMERGCKVYDFNGFVTSRARRVFSVSGKKDDEIDAKTVYTFASKMENLLEVSLETIEQNRLIAQRKLFVKQRVELTNNLKAKFIQKGFDKLPYKNMSTKKAINWLLNNDDIELKLTGKVIQELENSISILTEKIKELTPPKAMKLTQIKGIGELTASIIFAETKGRKVTKAQFANYCGVAPVKSSSGQTSRYRHNKRGNRVLNSILYSVSMKQAIYDKKGSDYYVKKLNEGKTPRHAKKCLARQICNQIWKVLNED